MWLERARARNADECRNGDTSGCRGGARKRGRRKEEEDGWCQYVQRRKEASQCGLPRCKDSDENYERHIGPKCDSRHDPTAESPRSGIYAVDGIASDFTNGYN